MSVPAMIHVGSCINCSKPIFMTAEEKDFYDEQVRTRPGFVFPKRCRTCIFARKKQQLLHSVNTLRLMAEKAVEGQYEGMGDILAQEISDVANHLEKYVKSAEEKHASDPRNAR